MYSGRAPSSAPVLATLHSASHSRSLPDLRLRSCPVAGLEPALGWDRRIHGTPARPYSLVDILFRRSLAPCGVSQTRQGRRREGREREAGRHGGRPRGRRRRSPRREMPRARAAPPPPAPARAGRGGGGPSAPSAPFMPGRPPRRGEEMGGRVALRRGAGGDAGAPPSGPSLLHLPSRPSRATGRPRRRPAGTDGLRPTPDPTTTHAGYNLGRRSRRRGAASPRRRARRGAGRWRPRGPARPRRPCRRCAGTVPTMGSSSFPTCSASCGGARTGGWCWFRTAQWHGSH